MPGLQSPGVEGYLWVVAIDDGREGEDHTVGIIDHGIHGIVPVRSRRKLNEKNPS